MIKRIALVGASSTGKTTVFELLKNKFPKYEFVNESTRSVAEYGFPINEAGTSETQLAISSFHLEALLKPYNLILDRCYMDLVVYSHFMDSIDAKVLDYIEDTWNRVKSAEVVESKFYLVSGYVTDNTSKVLSCFASQL